MMAPVPAAAVLLAYGASLWWLLRHESRVQPGSRIVARVSPAPNAPANAALLRVTTAGEGAPYLEWVAPEAPGQAG